MPEIENCPLHGARPECETSPCATCAEIARMLRDGEVPF